MGRISIASRYAPSACRVAPLPAEAQREVAARDDVGRVQADRLAQGRLGLAVAPLPAERDPELDVEVGVGRGESATARRNAASASAFRPCAESDRPRSAWS